MLNDCQKRGGENKGTKKKEKWWNLSALNYFLLLLFGLFSKCLGAFYLFWSLTLSLSLLMSHSDFSLTTQCNLNISERAVSTCARLTCLVSRLVLLHFPLNTQIVLPLLSLKATHTDAHTSTYAQLTDTNSTLWHTNGTGQKTQTVVCRLCTEKVLFLMLLLFNKG